MIGMRYYLRNLFNALLGVGLGSNKSKYHGEGDCEIATADGYECEDWIDGQYDFLNINEHLHDGRPLHTVVYHRLTDELRFHIATWWKLAPVRRASYSFVMHRHDGDRYLLMLTDSEEARDEASAWLDDYFKKFQDNNYLDEYIPSLPNGEFKGYTVLRDTSEDNNPPSLFQTWSYILTTFQGKVYRTRINSSKDIFYFEDESEMLMFKMQHMK